MQIINCEIDSDLMKNDLFLNIKFIFETIKNTHKN